MLTMEENRNLNDISIMDLFVESAKGLVKADVISFSQRELCFKTSERLVDDYINIEFYLLTIPYKCRAHIIDKAGSIGGNIYTVELEDLSDIDLRLINESIMLIDEK